MLITTEQAKQHLKLNTSLNAANFAPFIPDAERKYIKPFLGNVLFEALDTWAETKEDDQETAHLVALYPYVVAALSRFTLLIAVPHLNVHVGESGFGVVDGGNLAPASKERVADFKASTEQLAWDNIEDLLQFLEENKDDYDEWTASEAFTMQIKNLINSATEFDKHVDIDQSRLTFHKMRKHITNIEDMFVKGLISEEYYDEIIEKIRDEEVLNDNEVKLLNHLRAFIANKVAFEQLKANTDMVATYHFNEARVIINKYPDDFPTFVASDLYDEAEKPFTSYENDEESAIFSAVI